MRRLFLFAIISLLVFSFSSAWAQKTVRISIATGGTGGVYYPMGGGMANILSKYISYLEATAEVTTASVDNCLLVGKQKAELAFIMADTGWDAYMGRAQFKEKVALRTLAVLYPNNMHIVTVEGKGIDKVSDLKGKRVSTGAPGSGTEVMGLRVIEANGLDPNKDMTRDKLGVSESAGALKDGKIDAFFWVGGLPTAAITDLGATPGVKIKLLNSGDAVPKMREKYGPLYVKGVIPAKTYRGQDTDVPIAVVWNLLICNEKMKEDVAYDILKTLFDHKTELVASHGDARHLSPESQAGGGSPIPFHPGAVRYFAEKGIQVK
ncbi:MAG TPA: TAXI family TRAP transporter solute-binding subunit [Thermodesulfobacteriota bacterium]|nr:TAXI family TRAP transporter solute-binding subunit [Thermodesulfobacteriota bacterium]